MKKALLLFAVLALLAGCSLFNNDVVGSGKIATQDREVHNFSRILVAGLGNVFIEQGTKEGLRIETDENLLPYIKTEVVDGALRIEQKTSGLMQNLKPSKDINYFISVQNISEVALAGRGKIASQNELKSEKLEVNVSGSGKVDLVLNVQTLISSISGSSQFTLKGTAQLQEIQVSGSALYDAQELVTKGTNINLSGYGKLTVNAEDRLDVQLTGNGTVYYLGKPELVQQITGNGKIEPVR